MKLENGNSDSAYNLSYKILRFSGFIFFTIKATADKAIEYHQAWSDYAIFIVSFVFSLVMFLWGTSDPFNLQLQSTVMKMGTNILWGASAMSVVITKIIQITRGRKVFNIFLDLKWFDQQVG